MLSLMWFQCQKICSLNLTTFEGHFSQLFCEIILKLPQALWQSSRPFSEDIHRGAGDEIASFLPELKPQDQDNPWGI